MAERVLRKPAHSKKRDDKDAQSSSTSKDIPSSRTTEGASTHRPGSADSHSHSSHNVTVVTSKSRTSDLRALFERNESKSPGGEVETRRQRTNPVNVEVIPEPRLINVGSNGPGTKQPPASSSSSNRDKRFTVQSKISVKSSYDSAMRLKSNPGDTRVTTSPPLSPPPDENTVRHKPPLSGASYAILPDQTNPLGAARTSAAKGLTQSTTTGSTETSVTKGLITTNAEGISSSSKVRVPIRFSSSHGGGGPQSLPSPTTSSGDLSSNEILSSGDRLSSEHTIAQANSLNTACTIHVVDGHGHRSFDVNRQDLTVVQPTSQQLIDERFRAMATPNDASQDNKDEDDTLLASTCHGKIVLQNKSLDVNEEGHTILRTVSEGGGVTVKKDIQIRQLQEEKRQLMAKLEERDNELEELRQSLSVQTPPPPPPGGEYKAQDSTARREKEPEYTQQMYINYLTGEVNRLTPLVDKNEGLKRQLKHLEEVNKEAKLYESKVIEQVMVISEKDAEIDQLKRELEQSSDAALREQLTKNELEISRLKARLSKQEKGATGSVGAASPVDFPEASSTDGPHNPRSSGDVAAFQADFEQKMKRKEVTIEKLKKRVNDLTEQLTKKARAAGYVPPEDSQQKLADIGVADEEGVVKECLNGTEYLAEVEELQTAVKERDERIKTVTSQLQELEKMAGNVVQMHKHSRDQSELIAQLRKQVESAGDGNQAAATIQDLQVEVESLKEKLERREVKISQKRQEIEHLKKNTSTADATMRKLMIKNSQLEAEKTRLINEGHRYANTKLEQTEREKAALLKRVEEQERMISSMDAKVNQLSQQNRALEEQTRVLAKIKEEKEHLEQRVLSQLATIQNLDQELHDTKHRATELYSTLEQQKVEASQLQKAKQTLEGEVEAHKMTAQIYREDFETERKDREKAHALHVDLEERYQKEFKELKHQFQLVSADCGRLTQQLQSERVEKSKHIEDLRADKNTLQGEIQSKTQQVKQYKKQVDQFRGELDRCRADIEAFKQQAEHHKKQIEGVVNQCEHSNQRAKTLEQENLRLKKEIHTLQAREHLMKHAQAQQGGRDRSPINIDEFMKERMKAQEMERLANELRQRLDAITVEKVVVVSELEELKKRVHVPSRSSSSSRSPPPTVSTAAGTTTRPPPYPGHRPQGGSALPNPVRPQHQFPPQNHRLNQQMKSVSVDSADGLSSRGHIDSAQFQAPIPSVRVASSNPEPPPTTTRSEAPHRDPRYQQGPQTRPKSHTSNILSPQRDLAVSHPFLAANCVGNAQSVAHGGGHQALYYSSAGHNMPPTNAGMGGWNGQYSAMSSPPTNAKYNSPFTTANVVMPGQQSGGNYPQTFPHRVGGSAGTVQQQPPQPHGTQLAPGLSQASTFASNAPGPNVAQSMAGSRVPPFTGHGPSAPVGQAQTAVSSDAAQRQLYQNLPLDHQFHDQHNLSPPPDDGQGSGHMSLPSFGSGGFQQPQAQSPVHNHQQANHPYSHQVPKDDMYLLQQQKSAHGGYHHRHHHPAGDGGAHGYRAAVDVVEKDSSPPSSLVPQGHSQQGKHLSLNPQGLSPAIQPHHQHRSHQHPLSPEHLKNNMGIAGGANKPRRVKADSSRPAVGGGSGLAGMRQGDLVQLAPHHGHSAQALGQLQHVQQHQGHNMTGGAVVNQQQRAHSHALKGPIMESGLGSTKLPPSLQKQHGSGGNVYVSSQERRNEDSRSPYVKEHRPEPDSDSVSNVSMESGLTSPTGDGSENTLEKGIDGDIRRAARNVKKQMAGRELSVGGGGVEAPYDPNLTCPSCGLRFRIGEIQKFKRHASTCTGT